MRIFWLVIGSYLLGSIPFGYLFGRMQGVDIRSYGSGNIGATNALRVLGPVAGVLVLICDLAKGLLPALLAGLLLGPGWGILAGLSAVIGHNWSIFLGFKGGRGAATAAGVCLALVPKVILLALVIWVLVILISGYVSLGTLAAAVAAPIIAPFFHTPAIYYLFLIPVPLIVIYRHLPNIRRLQNGTESKIRFW